jgi:EpsD family peptidyl-prolyl cis-trans isomerase
MHQSHKLFILIAVLSLALSACDGKRPAASAASKAAVKVNGQAILEAEIQAKSTLSGGAGGKQEPVSEQAMESMVNMELMRQAAVQAKLDADETVQTKIANSLRSILAMAYMEKLLASAGKPTDAEISAYYEQNPERYAQRKLYDLREVLIQTSSASEAEIKEQLGKLKKADPFEQWLTQGNIPHQSNPVSILADRVPEDMFQQLKKVPVGGYVVLDGKEPMQVLFVLSEKMQPATLGQVSQQIWNTLFEQRRKAALDNAIKQQRDQAKIEYVPPYSASGLAVDE